jgi:hypothetical protein
VRLRPPQNVSVRGLRFFSYVYLNLRTPTPKNVIKGESKRKIKDKLLPIKYVVLNMTCYFRLMKDIFTKDGVEVTKENRKDIDRKIHSIVGVEYKNCSATWKEVKRRIAENEESFITIFKEALR